jgi:hypothetical protein
MGIFTTFSRRNQPYRPRPYEYEKLPKELRNQIIHIWGATIGPYFAVNHWETTPESNGAWDRIHNTAARELGVMSLQPYQENHFAACANFLFAAETDDALDVIDISFHFIDVEVRRWGYVERESSRATETATEAIDELNARFRQHGIGYQFVGGQLARVDSDYLHSEAVEPAVVILRDARFDGALQEFLGAHKHYREGRNKEAINEALKAFESTMKTIADRRHWRYDSDAPAQSLIDVMFKNGLIPTELTSQFTSLRALLESGVPTLRNRNSAHGQGAKPVEVPDYLAGYALHLTSSNILLLIQAFGVH